MLQIGKRLTFCALLLLAATATRAVDAPTPPKGGALDGLQFRGQTGEQGKGDHHEDTITFANGRFRSLDCEEWGFASAPYTVTREGDTYHFAATLPSPDRGTLEWKGTITGDRAEATFRWLHERWYWNIDRQYWFRGMRYAGR